jgi:hypothetical protein
MGPVGSALIKVAEANGWTPHQLSKAITREAANVTNLGELAARLGVDPTMGAPFSSWNDNRMSAAQMGPGAPARAFPLGGEPRQFQYRVGANFPTNPDTDRGIDSSLLRVLADSFDLMRLCIEIRKHDITHLAWDIVPIEKNRSKRDAWMKENGKDLDLIKQFFEWPEAYMTQDAAGHWVRRGKVKWEDWLGALLEDYFVGDWLTIWPRTMRSGALLAFDRVDGSTIKPLLDLDGRLPEPPTPAYQQYLYGVPRASFTLEELLYRPRLVRNHSVFGFSHVEQMLVLVNMALRFQMWNTQGFTESSLPMGLLVFPENFSPDQIEAIVEQLNAAISGLSGARQQFHGVPYGTEWKALKPFDFDETFAQYVVEYTAAMFGLNAQKLGFMPGRGGQGLGGKGFAEQQSNDAEEKATMPDARWVEGLMNELVERCFGRDDVEFVFTDLQDTDEKAQIDADQAAILAGLKSWDQALEERGEEPVGINEPFIVIGNTPWTVTDIKAAQEGEPRNPQLPALPVDEQPDDDPQGGGNGGAPPPPGPGGPQSAGPQPASPVPPGPAAEQQKPKPGEQVDNQQDEPAAPVAKPGQKPAKPDTDEDAEKFDTSSGMQPHGLVGPDVDELRRWKRHATKAAREGRRQRPFETDLIPDQMKMLIADHVEHAASPDEVRAIFDTAIDLAKAASHPMGVEGLEWANYRHQDTLGGRDCGTCSYWRAGNCAMFAEHVDPDYVCDEWTDDEPVEKAATGSVASSTVYDALRETYPADVLGWVGDADWSIRRAVPLAQIQMARRPGGRDPDKVDGIVQAINAGKKMDPVVLVATPSGEKLEIADGYHRTLAFEKAGKKTIAAYVGKVDSDSGPWDRAMHDGKLNKMLLAEIEKAAKPRDDDTAREQHIKALTAAGAALLATRAAASYGTQVAVDQQVDDMVKTLASHYRQAAQAGSRAAARDLGVAELTPEQLDAIASTRAEAQRASVRVLVDQAATGTAQTQAIHFLARGSKPAYEHGYGSAVSQAAPEATATWNALGDPCDLCAAFDGQEYTVETLPGYPGEGDFGDTCEGGPNCRCELEWSLPSSGDDEQADADELINNAGALKSADIEPVPPEPSVGEQLLERGISALEKIADKPPAQVTVEPAQVTVEAPPPSQVTVTPQITVEAAKAPDVQVTVQPAKRGGARVEKTKDGGLRLIPEED